jgi:ribosomal protein S18 acetylase RimI-like enzyme
MGDRLTIEFIDRDDPRISQLQPLFKEYYRSMAQKDLMMDLVENGDDLWVDGVRKGLGRFSQIAAAIDGDSIVGFIVGYLKITPSHLGSRVVGYIDALFVKEEYRKGPIVLILYKKLLTWFSEKKVHSLEMQVLVENEDVWMMWEKLGFRRELFQLRKLL